MSCGGGHLGFPIHIKNRNLVKDISIREEILWNFSQSEHIIGPGSHVEYLTGTKNRNFVEDHPRNIPPKLGSNWPSGFGEEAWNVKSLWTTDDGRQVMAIVHLDLWSRWTKKLSEKQNVSPNRTTDRQWHRFTDSFLFIKTRNNTKLNTVCKSSVD